MSARSTRRRDGQLRRRTEGYTASCCFAPSAPICFATAARFGALIRAPVEGAPGAARRRRPARPPPRRARASRARRCRTARTTPPLRRACCFQPDAPVCVAVNVARACARTSTGGSGRCSTPPPRCADANPRAVRPRDGLVVHRHHRLFPGDMLLRGPHAARRERRQLRRRHRRARRRAPSTDAGSSGGQDARATGGSRASTGTGGATRTGGTTGGGGAGATTGTGGTTRGGTGGTTGGDECAPRAACNPRYRCGGRSPAACMECVCGGDVT